MGQGASTPQDALKQAAERLGQDEVVGRDESDFWGVFVGQAPPDAAALSAAADDAARKKIRDEAASRAPTELTTDQIFEAVTYASVRAMRKKKSGRANLHRLVRVLTDAIALFAEREMAAPAARDAETTGALERSARNAQETKALNALRLLTRIVPVVLEDATAEELIFWKVSSGSSRSKKKGSSNGADAAVSPGKAEAEDHDDDDDDDDEHDDDDDAGGDDGAGATKSKKSKKQKKKKQKSAPVQQQQQQQQQQGARRPPRAPVLRTKSGSGVPEAVRLLDALMAMCFIEDFTIPRQATPQQAQGEQRGWLLPLHCIWAAGVGTSSVPEPADFRAVSEHRVDVLRLLLACSGGALFEGAAAAAAAAAATSSGAAPAQKQQQEQRPAGGRWLAHLAGTNGYYSLAFFFSLLNVSVSYDPVGWGVPYNYLMFNDDAEPLTDAALHMLLVLLFHAQPVVAAGAAPTAAAGAAAGADGAPAAAGAAAAAAADAAASAPGASAGTVVFSPPNVFVECARSLRRTEDFEVLFDSLLRLLRNPAYAGSTMMPGSTKEIGCHQELLLLFWKLLEENAAFRAFVCAQPPVLLAQMVDTLLFFVREHYASRAQSGLVYLCVFVLLLLSSEREFAVALNEPFAGALPADWNISLPVAKGAAKRVAAALAATQASADLAGRAAERRRKALAGTAAPTSAAQQIADQTRIGTGLGFATYADYLVIVFRHVLSEMPAAELGPLLEPLCTVLANVSPYIKQLTTASSAALASLLTRFLKPSFLLAAEHNHRLLTYILEVFNNVLQYHGSSHPRLIFCLVFRQNDIEKNCALTLDTARKAADSTAAAGAPEAGAASTPKGVDAIAAAPGWAPTQEWWDSWYPHLATSAVQRTLAAVAPKLKAAQDKQVRAGLPQLTEDEQIGLLQSDTLVGVLPVPHPILIRRYERNEYTAAWFSSFLWGLIFRRNRFPNFVASHAAVKIFKVLRLPAAEAAEAAAAASSSATGKAADEPAATEEEQ